MFPSAQTTAPRMVDAAPQYVTTQVATALNETKNASSSDGSLVLRAGILDAVTPMSFAGTAIPRGRMYAECQVLDQAGNVVGVLWRGYLQTTGGQVAGVSSSPGMVVEVGWRLRAVVTQTGRGSAGVQVGFVGRVTSILREGGFIHHEAPGSGQGEVTTVTLAAPAAGADYAMVSPGAKTKSLLVGFFGTITASASAGDRTPRVFYRDSSNNSCRAVVAPATVAASQSATERWGLDVEPSSLIITNHHQRLSSKPVPVGGSFHFNTSGMLAGDQWSAGLVELEEWAVPTA